MSQQYEHNAAMQNIKLQIVQFFSSEGKIGRVSFLWQSLIVIAILFFFSLCMVGSFSEMVDEIDTGIKFYNYNYALWERSWKLTPPRYDFDFEDIFIFLFLFVLSAIPYIGALRYFVSLNKRRLRDLGLPVQWFKVNAVAAVAFLLGWLINECSRIVMSESIVRTSGIFDRLPVWLVICGGLAIIIPLGMFFLGLCVLKGADSK